MRGRGTVPVITTLLVVVAMSAASAAPVQRPHFGSSISTTTPAGGSNEVSSGTVPKGFTEVDMLLGAEAGQTDLFKTMTFALMTYDSLKSRTLGCFTMAAVTMDRAVEQLRDRHLDEEKVEAVARTRSLAMAAMCLRLARLLTEVLAEPPPVRAARPRCDVEPLALKVRTERTESGDIRIVPVGQVKSLRKTPAKLTCKGTASTLKIKMKTKKSGSIRQAFGKKIQLGIVSPSNAEDDAHIKVGFR